MRECSSFWLTSSDVQGGLALALARLVQSMWAPGRDGSLHKRTQEFNDAVYAFGRQKRPPTFVRGTHQDISVSH